MLNHLRHPAMTGRLVGFLKVQCLVGVSHEIGRGAQGDLLTLASSAPDKEMLFL